MTLPTFWCKKAQKVAFINEVDAKIALADRQRRDKGEKRHYPCGAHFHLTSQEKLNAAA